MQSLSTFIKLSGPISEVQRSMIMKIYIISYWEKYWVKRSASKQLWFVTNTFGGSKDWCHPRKVLLFLSSFIGNSIHSILTKKLLYKDEHFFFLKTGNLILNWSPSLFYKQAVSERLSSQSDKYKMKETSSIPISQLFNELVTIWKHSILFLELGKIEKSSHSNIQKCHKISLSIGENSKVPHKTNAQSHI